MTTTRAPFGSWTSPLSASRFAEARTSFEDIQCDGDDVFWIEQRPADGGRCVIVRHRNGGGEDVLPAPFSARTRVNEYGGGAFAVKGGTVYFSDASDGRVRQVTAEGGVQTLTSEVPGDRFADFVVDARRNRLVCIRERHDGGGEPRQSIVSISLDGGRVEVLVDGADFYSDARLASDGRRMCWLSWSHPDMPWDATELWVADVDSSGLPVNAARVGGGDGSSVLQPRWSPTGVLHAVSDLSGWWNLYRENGATLEPLAPCASEFAAPPWTLGRSHYAFTQSGDIVCASTTDGVWLLQRLTRDRSRLEDIPLDATELGSWVSVVGDRCVLDVASPLQATAVASIDLRGGGVTMLRPPPPALDAAWVSVPQPLRFSTADGSTGHALFYPPQNPTTAAESDELPPLLVLVHGGPTAQFPSSLDLRVQFWTTRGIAVVGVNYGGSSGFGRAYRERLNSRWGEVDVDDCVGAALHLVAEGRVDPQRLAIAGSSAGGFTALAALAFRDVFHAGISRYGVADLESLAHDTHKFESRYLDRLVGPFPGAREVYVQRSPVHHASQIERPVLLLQGTEDRVVPPEQARMMRDALRERGIPCAYVAFEGEGHGFRRADSMVRAIESELSFLGQVFGFATPGVGNPLTID